MEGRTTPPNDAEEPPVNYAIPYDKIYQIGKSLPPNSPQLSGLCRASHLFYNTFQNERIAFLLSKLLADDDANHLPENIQAVRQLLAIKPAAIKTSINLFTLNETSIANEKQDITHDAHYRNIILYLIGQAKKDDNTKWVVDVMSLLHHNLENIKLWDDTHEFVLNLAVEHCVTDIINFLYDHQLINCQRRNGRLLSILENEFDIGRSNWNGRKSLTLNRLCIEQQYLFFYHSRPIEPREFNTILRNMNESCQIARHAYFNFRYQLTQFYLRQLTDMTPQILFNDLLNQGGEILEKDIKKILNNTHGLTTRLTLKEILVLLLLSDYSQKSQRTLGNIGLLLHQNCREDSTLTEETAHHQLMLATTFMCAGGKATINQPALVISLQQLIGIQSVNDTISLADLIETHAETLLTLIDSLIKFYSDYLGILLEPFHQHPFLALQAHAAITLNQQLRQTSNHAPERLSPTI